jgi:hypothetical protein
MKIYFDKEIISYENFEDYQKSLEAMLSRSMEKMYEMVDQDFIIPNGKGVLRPDPRIMQIIFSMHKHLEDRVKGTVVQQNEQRNLNVNVTKDLREVSEDALDRKINELRERERKAIGQFSGNESRGTSEEIEVTGTRGS